MKMAAKWLTRAGRVALIAGMPVWLAGCVDVCQNLIQQEVVSPDGKLTAIVFQRDCGATTGFSTQVCVLPANTTLTNERGNVFVADDNHGAAPSADKGGPPVTITWQGNRQLRVSYDARVRVFVSNSKVSVPVDTLAGQNVMVEFAKSKVP